MLQNLTLRYFIYGQLCFYVGVAICTALKPQVLNANSGISYFGVYERTVVPYTLALLGSAFYMFLSGHWLSLKKYRVTRTFLTYAPLLVVGIVATPYTASATFNNIHIAFGAALFSLQLIYIGWVTLRNHNIVNVILFLGMLASGIAAAHYVSPAHGFLIQAMIIFQLCFGVFMVNYLRDTTKTPKKTRTV